MGFYGGNVFQLVPVIVVRQWFPKFVHVVSKIYGKFKDFKAC